MLPKANRLIKKKDFKIVLKKGRKIFAGPIWLMFKKNNLGLTRVGFVVGLKISKKATERNKIKRRLRSAFRCFLKEVSGYDIIIGVEPKIKEKKISEIVRGLNDLLLRIK